MNVLVCSGEVLKAACQSAPYLSYRPEDKAELLQIADLIIVQYTCDWDTGVKNGQHFIFQLRLKHNSVHPIIMTYMDREEIERCEFKQIAQDPYVRILSFPKLIDLLKDHHQLFSLFGEIQPPEDRRLLLQDLKTTLYKRKGYIFEIKHRLTQALGELNHFEIDIVKDYVIDHWTEVNRVISVWESNGIHTQSTKTLVRAIDKMASKQEIMGFLSEQFDQVGQQVNEEVEQPKVLQEPKIIKVIYISDNEQNRSDLAERFKTTFPFYHIFCITVADTEHAIQVLHKEKGIAAVICDYRFYEENRISKVNGYLIIRDLKGKYPYHYYCLLTDYHIDGIINLSEDAKEVYIKWNTLDPNGSELARLARAIIQWEQSTRIPQDSWPPSLTTQTDKRWREYYNIYLSHPEFSLWERELSERAEVVLTNIISGNLAVVEELPNVGYFFDRVTTAPLQSLKDRLLIRRIVIGLLQYEKLDQMYPPFIKACEHSNRYTNYFALIFFILHKSKPNHHALADSKALSYYFSGCLRIKVSKKYTLGSRGLADRITRAEFEWLHHVSKLLT